MRTARIVAYHAVQRIVRVGCGIGCESETCFAGCVTQVIEHHAGLRSCRLRITVYLQDLVQILGKIHHHGNVATLPAQAGAAVMR